MTTIREQLEESQKVCEAATERPWEARGGYQSVNVTVKNEGEARIARFGDPLDTQQWKNATFIAHAHTELPLRNAQLAAVLKVHQPIDALNVNARNHHKVQVCTGCGQDDGNWNRYPCPTVRAIEDAAP